ncbi:MAG TPA: polyhydroxyalkanoate depolymerase [Acetobacteraceae bacterium]|nr:polyhydroxyalkanoate depolymerase [Acetobacteraceae bacterium]
MIYQLYQAQTDLLSPVRYLARLGAGLAQAWDMGAGTPAVMRQMGAACNLIANSAPTHRRPDYGVESVNVGGEILGVTEEVADSTPFGTLLRFHKEGDIDQPRVLLVAPMSGHFSTLLRDTIRTMLPSHDVYVTDWRNARDIPVTDGTFGLDEFIDHLIRFSEVVGPGGHMVAVCQPAVPALAAVALMAEDDNAAQPRSLTLMAGPIDTRQNPTKVNELAKSRPIEWFERNLIGRVPWRYRGAGRHVYPGFLQLSAFVSMNLDRHINAHAAQFRALACRDMASAVAHRRFYDEYAAVMDLPAEFYLETVQCVFQNHDLPLDRLMWRGRAVRPAAIRQTALLTVEGERDDICAIGQTVAALDLCTGIPDARKRHHLQHGVGHYGVFSGSRWGREVYPEVRSIIQANSQ